MYSVQSIDQVVQQFNSHPVKGLASQSVPTIRGVHGPNEFEVDAKESVLKKFLAQFYESPLNLLLLGSAAISYVVGNTDDAISITAAIVIVVTGIESFSLSKKPILVNIVYLSCVRYRFIISGFHSRKTIREIPGSPEQIGTSLLSSNTRWSATNSIGERARTWGLGNLLRR